MGLFSLPCLLALSLFAQDGAGEIDRLIRSLKTEDAAQRRGALAELLRRGAEAVPAAILALDDSRPGPEGDVAALVRRLASEKWKDRDGAVRGLVDLGTPAREILEKMEKPDDPEVAWRIHQACAEIERKAGERERIDEAGRASLCEFLGEAGDPRGVKPLLGFLTSATGEVTPCRIRAADALGALRGVMEPAQAEEAGERVLAMIGAAAAAEQKGLLLKALTRLKPPGCVAPLTRRLADPEERNVLVRTGCLAALAAVGSAESLRPVVEALETEEVYVRHAAAVLLEGLAGDAFGYDPRASAEANAPAVAKFRSWWSGKFSRDW